MTGGNINGKESSSQFRFETTASKICWTVLSRAAIGKHTQKLLFRQTVPATQNFVRNYVTCAPVGIYKGMQISYDAAFLLLLPAHAKNSLRHD